MWSLIAKGIAWVLGKLFGPKPGPSQEAVQAANAASATTRAQGDENALAELKAADAARADAERRSLHDAGTGTTTVDPSAAINAVDTEDRRD